MVRTKGLNCGDFSDARSIADDCFFSRKVWVDYCDFLRRSMIDDDVFFWSHFFREMTFWFGFREPDRRRQTDRYPKV